MIAKITLIVLVMLASAPRDEAQTPKRVDARVVQVAEILRKHHDAKRRYTSFFRVPSMHAGIYTLPKGSEDKQSPHAQDEAYYVLKGRAKLEAGGRKETVTPGSFVFVAAHEKHRFVEIVEELELLVFFTTGPTQASPKKGAKERKTAETKKK